MTTGKQHISEGDFKRYRDNEMTNTERNAFEKILQNNPFEAEALEGFESFAASSIETDLHELQSKIQTKKRTNRIPYFAAAATILLLVTAGILWIQLDKQNPLPETTEAKIKVNIQSEQEKEQLKSQPLEMEEQALPLEAPKPQQQSAEKNMRAKENTALLKSTNTKQNTVEIKHVEDDRVLAVPNSITIEEKPVVPKVKPLETASYVAPANKQKKEQVKDISKNNIVRGRIVSADDQMPIAGATIIEKGTNNGIVTDVNGQFKLQLEKDSNATVVASFIGMETNEFQPTNDSNMIQLKSDDIDLSEVVVVGYGTQQKQAVTGSSTKITENNLNSKASPVVGMKAYNKYLDEATILPPEHSNNKVSLKLILSLNKNGGIDSIDYEGSNTELLKLAKKIILEGPDWNPKYDNGQKISSKVNLKVTFRKEKE